jgi:hypothetical protein
MRIAYLLLFVLLASSCVQNVQHGEEAGESINEEKTKEVLDHHWEAFKSNNLEETMEDYTEESVLVTPNATYTGLDEIRTNFVNAFKAFPKDSTTFTLNKSIAVKDIGYILWGSKTPGFNLSYATDTFIIRDGKIIRQTFAGVFE